MDSTIDQLYTVLSVASQNGLFPEGRDGDARFGSLKGSLSEAYTSLHPTDENTEPSELEAQDHVQDFVRGLRSAQENAGAWWRFNFLYAAPAWVYLLTAPLPYLLILRYFQVPLSPALQSATMWGLLGGCLQGFYWIWQQVSKEQFRGAWAFWILSLPPGGAIFGALAYMFLAGGVLTALSTSSPSVNPLSALLFSALAGFSWKDFAALIKGFWSRLGAGSSKPGRSGSS